MASETLKTAWRRQAQWSNTANQVKADYERWRNVMLILAVVAAISGTLSGFFYTRIFASLAAVAAALSPLIATMKLSGRNLQQWLRARSVSEAIKAEIFTYLTSQDVLRESVLSEAQQSILNSVGDIAPQGLFEQVPKEAILEDLSAQAYLEKRVESQIRGYYLPRSARHAAIARRYKSVYFMLMLTGAAIGGVNSVFDNLHLGPWIAVITTISASLMAHLAAGQQEHLALSYRATADRLRDMKDRWIDRHGDRQPESPAVSDLVLQCEAAISVQNQDWHAKLAKTADGAPVSQTTT